MTKISVVAGLACVLAACGGDKGATPAADTTKAAAPAPAPAGATHDVNMVLEGTTYKFCDACWELMHEFTDGNAVCFGVLWENFGEAWSGGASISSCINRVSSVAAKSKLLTRWRKYKGLEFR